MTEMATHMVHYKQLIGGRGQYVADASDLALGPGDWPEQITVVGAHRVSIVFHRHHPVALNSELHAWCYFTQDGAQQLTIYND